MARKKFEEGFKENAIEYCKAHSDKTIKACAEDLGIGYSTLRRWISQSEEELEAESAVMTQPTLDEVMEKAEEVAELVLQHKAFDDDVVEAENEEPTPEPTEDVIASEEIQEPAEVAVEYVNEDALDAQDEPQEFDWAAKREQVKNQLGGLIETAGSGVSDAVQLIGLYKKRHDLKKVQKKLQKEKEKRMK